MVFSHAELNASSRVPQMAAIVFRKYGEEKYGEDLHFLSKAWDGNETTSTVLAKSKREREVVNSILRAGCAT